MIIFILMLLITFLKWKLFLRQQFFNIKSIIFLLILHILINIIQLKIFHFSSYRTVSILSNSESTRLEQGRVNLPTRIVTCRLNVSADSIIIVIDLSIWIYISLSACCNHSFILDFHLKVLLTLLLEVFFRSIALHYVLLTCDNQQVSILKVILVRLHQINLRNRVLLDNWMLLRLFLFHLFLNILFLDLNHFFSLNLKIYLFLITESASIH